MKKAVITSGGKQYIVSKDNEIEIDLLPVKDKVKTINFEPLLVIDDNKKVKIGQPALTGQKVTAEILEIDKKGEKVTSIRYKAKKRVHKVKGHRQRHAKIRITSIS
jgi:large subunit ribosomal protein L21